MSDNCKYDEFSLDPREKHKRFLLRNIVTIAEILEALYKSPNHGNKSKPIDELIYILLSKKTSEKGYSESYNRLSLAYPDWAGLVNASPQHVRSLVQSAGLGNQRTKELLNSIRGIQSKFGKLTLDQLKVWPNGKIFNFLTSLDGIGPKSAYCIMMYSMKKAVFPVDTHVHTICERMGFIDKGLDHDKAQEILADICSIFPCFLAHSLSLCSIRDASRTAQPLRKHTGQEGLLQCHQTRLP